MAAQLCIDFEAARFNGPDLVAVDHARLGEQLQRIFDLMRDGQFRTLREIREATGAPESSISSQLRHLRKPRFGSHVVERDHVSNGLYQYRLIVNPTPTT